MLRMHADDLVTALRPRGRRIRAFLVTGVVAWMLVVTILGARLAWELGVGPMLDGVGRSQFLVAGFAYAACLGSTIITWRLRPTATFAVAVGAAAVIVSIAAVVTGSAIALASVAGVGVVAWLVGEAVVGGTHPPHTPYLVRAVLAFALGNGLLGLVFLLLGSVDRLDTNGLGFAMSAIAVLALIGVFRRTGVRRSMSWKLESATGWEAFVLGSTSGLVAYALLTTLLPEIASDATREHLLITRQIWETGSTSGLARWWTASQPIHAQLVSVVGWAVGGDVGVKLSHALVGLAAVAGVGSLAWLLAGRAAAVVAAAIFATIPIVQWELGHAYVDLYPALFCTSAAIAIVIWQQSGRRAMLLIGGAAAGFALVAKVVSAGAIAGLVLALALVGRARWRLRDRAEAVVAFALGGLVALPWLYWGFSRTGSVPGLDYAVNAIFDQSSDVVGLWAGFGIGRDPLSIAIIPWVATFQGERFAEIGMGLLGILPLVTLPAVLFVPRSRTVAFVTLAALIAYLGWAFSAQYLRYGLPVIALGCALLGAGVSGLGGRLAGMRGGWPRYLLFGLFAVGLVITPVLTMTNWLFRMPPRYFIGELSRDGFLAENVPGYRVMDRSTALVGAGNMLEWVGLYDLPEIFTEAVPLGLTPPPPGTPVGQILTALRARGASHFAWERNGTDLDAWRSPMLSLEFLRNHTDILYAADNTYLFEVFDEPRDRWGFASASILSPTPGQSPRDSQWTLDGDVTTSGTSTVVREGAWINHETTVRGASPYLLVANASCDGAGNRLILALQWAGDDGPMGVDWQLVVPGVDPSEQFLWATAPQNATSALAQVSVWGDGVCMVDDVTLQEGTPREG
jgi:hypothetical protein